MAVHRPPFDSSQPLVSLKFFRYNGIIISRSNRKHLVGFPPEGVDVPERKLRQLYDARYIGYPDEVAPKVFPPVPPSAAQATEPEAEIEDESGQGEVQDENPPATTDQPSEDAQGAAGTAREAPSAEESTSAPSGSATAPATDAGAGEQTPPPVPAPDGEARPTADGENSGAVAAAAATPVATAENQADNLAGQEEAAAARAALIEKLKKGNSHEALLTKASGIKGATKDSTKAELAALLIDAGRVGDDGSA